MDVRCPGGAGCGPWTPAARSRSAAASIVSILAALIAAGSSRSSILTAHEPTPKRDPTHRALIGCRPRASSTTPASARVGTARPQQVLASDLVTALRPSQHLSRLHTESSLVNLGSTQSLTRRLSAALVHPTLLHFTDSTATVKLDSQETPPPLTYSPNASDRGRESTAETTPVSTPIEQAPSPQLGRPRKDRDLYFSWHRKPHELGGTRSLHSEPDLLFEDTGDCSFPLFPESPPENRPNFDKMASAASPIDISAAPRFNSSSPRNQTSNLTFALQEAGATHDHGSTSHPNVAGGNDFSAGRLSVGGRHESISNGLGSSFYGSGARPISMKDRPRRESNNMGSFAGGVSWGGVSVGSWIRDDILMTGTSPAFNQSPSFHSSSYLPKLEANFMKDFTCCGLTLASLHDLLQHFEETHANAPASRTSQSAQGGLPPATGVSTAGVTAAQTQTQGEAATHTQHGFQPRSNSLGGFRNQRLGSDGFSRTNLSTVQDMDSLEDMEMDDVGEALPPIEEQATPFSSQQSQFNQNQSQLQPLNVNLANTMQNHQGLRTSTPTTPAASQGFGLQNNPTVSSVNTPTLGTIPMQQNVQSRSSPESSHPGTPAELDMFFANNYNQSMMGGQVQDADMNFANMNMNFGNGMTGLPGFDGTIDQPGKRLFSKSGSGLTQQQLQLAFKNYQLGNPSDQSDLAKRLRAEQLLAGANIPQHPYQEEVKPFRCPVIGCEKAYKNQNGLKYHKQHGHQNQQLKENDDGTFSIVDPLTSIPYPGTIGMEKEKPYRCEVCGKRYKNLNGLKYHRAHAPHCNPELKLNQLGLTNNLQGINVNVAGAGMTGMDTSMF
ncbi:hypothetical protein BCR34DRAFT_647079 [Clohesyomyces aquaticus]|uniref:C2H2-type domain-containing protein n=1 Tax=Clohesyomyces aquaticus TaxID=1231657 RepID=A0A1Y1ZVD7_9PLEO|nr:hypothetical protein BCR34DRAFT_647079 [Clohesyomyces aquaticus]